MKPNNTVTHSVTTARLTKSEANRKNSFKSTGPKTSRGKNHSRNNALKHGLYSKELLISEADEPEYLDLFDDLSAQLKPSTRMQGNAFDSFVACNWRSKLALRLEQRQFARRFQDEKHESPELEATGVDAGIQKWYGSSWLDIRAGSRALEDAEMEFNELGYFREETRVFLKRAFGEDFLSLVEEWTSPMSLDAILLAQATAAHIKKFDQTPNKQVDESSTPGEATKVMIDPMQGRHMVCKLLEQRRNFLRELLIIRGRNGLDGRADTAQTSDFNPRFLADSNRELRRALDWYLLLKEKGL